jgi:hypothetical protein
MCGTSCPPNALHVRKQGFKRCQLLIRSHVANFIMTLQYRYMKCGSTEPPPTCQPRLPAWPLARHLCGSSSVCALCACPAVVLLKVVGAAGLADPGASARAHRQRPAGTGEAHTRLVRIRNNPLCGRRGCTARRSGSLPAVALAGRMQSPSATPAAPRRWQQRSHAPPGFGWHACILEVNTRVALHRRFERCG